MRQWRHATGCRDRGRNRRSQCRAPALAGRRDRHLIDNGAPGGATAAGAGILATISSRATDLETAGFRFQAARCHLELAANCEAVGLTGHSYTPVGPLTVAFDDGQADELHRELDRSLQLVRTFGAASVGEPQGLSANDIRSRHPLVAPTTGGL